MKFLLSLPKAAIVFLALFVSLLLIFIAQPPHTACQSQMEVIRANQTGFLYLDKKETYRKTTGYEKAVEVCKYGNSPGGCLDFFNGLRRLQKDLEYIPPECSSQVMDDGTINKTVWDSVQLMVQLAWGAKAPASYLDRQGWFDTFHMSIFCDLKRLLVNDYGKDRWASFINTQLQTLPQAGQLSRNDSWQRSIMSFNCDSI